MFRFLHDWCNFTVLPVCESACLAFLLWQGERSLSFCQFMRTLLSWGLFAQAAILYLYFPHDIMPPTVLKLGKVAWIAQLPFFVVHKLGKHEYYYTLLTAEQENYSFQMCFKNQWTEISCMNSYYHAHLMIAWLTCLCTGVACIMILWQGPKLSVRYACVYVCNCACVCLCILYLWTYV